MRSLKTSALLVQGQSSHRSTPSSVSEITGTPQFMALALLQHPEKRPEQNLDTELESLGYSLLYAAIADKLHWKHAAFGSPGAFDSKHNPMTWPPYFCEKVVSRIYLPPLRSFACEMRDLFFPSQALPHNVNDGFQRLLQKFV